MGSRDEEHPRKQLQQQHKLKILLLLLSTNLFTFYIFSSSSPFKNNNSSSSLSLSLSLSDLLNSTQHQLTSSHSDMARLLHQVDSLLSQLTKLNEPSTYSDEVRLVIEPHRLPLGYSPRTGSDEIYQPVGAGCLHFQDEFNQYMTYDIGRDCPLDDVFAQKLMLKGCEPLPRRRCRPKSPVNYAEPTPFPASMWTTPPDSSTIWDSYTCKSYKCLIDRKHQQKGYFDCKDCFDLTGREKTRWLVDNGELNYGIDQVLKTRPPGTIRIGFDIGGGTGTFAARMRERNVTILTSSMNLDGPFNNFIASRGLIPIHLSVSQRLPFFENTLDIVHSMHVLSNWIPDTMLEFTMYDIYRVLRPGGLFWLDHFFCLGSQLNRTYIPMLDRVGFNKLRWNAGIKLDRGINKKEWYFSALLEKPIT